MPVYQFSLVAKVNICMDGETPEIAAANLESLMEDAYMSAVEGFEVKFGKYPAKVWVQNDPPKLEGTMPEGYDPCNPPRMTMKRWMEMCHEPLSQEEADALEKILASGEAKCQDKPKAVPEVSAEEFLKKPI